MTEANKLTSDLEIAATSPGGRVASLQLIADTIRHSGNYRWVGLYDVEHDAGIITNIVWSGPGAPAHPQFSITALSMLRVKCATHSAAECRRCWKDARA